VRERQAKNWSYRWYRGNRSYRSNGWYRWYG